MGPGPQINGRREQKVPFIATTVGLSVRDPFSTEVQLQFLELYDLHLMHIEVFPAVFALDLQAV